MNSTQLNHLRVYTSSRSLKEGLNKQGNELCNAINLAEFYKKAVFVDGFNECGAIERVLFMQNAVAQTKSAKKLHFPSEFFEFMQHKDYLFKFFKELSHEKVSVANLDFSDVYAQYSEHFEILEELLTNYKNLLSEAKFYDDITLPEIYQINENYLKRFEIIEIFIDGNPSKFEFEIIKKASSITTILLNFKASKFNQKTLNSISELCGLDFESGFSYTLNLSERKIQNSAPLTKNAEILLKGFELRALQSAYIFEKISNFISSGIAPEKIAVILPDEKFSSTLKIFDEKIAKTHGRMLNFAMGERASDTLFGVSLAKISECLKEKITPNFAAQYKNLDKNLRRDTPNEYDVFFGEIGMSDEIFAKFRENFNQIVSYEIFDDCISSLLGLEKLASNEIAQKIKEPKFLISLLEGKDLTLSNLIDLFINELKNVKIDDTNGGKVTVMGILESRGFTFDGVIIADFNDDLIPKRIEGEMFLNSDLRAKAGLISHLDRENLQRFYYDELINGAKKVAISYHNTPEKSPSRFLKNFASKADDEFSTQDYLRIFSPNLYEKPNFSDFAPQEKHDFFEKDVSFSRLDTFIKCKKKYYFRYIQGLSEGLKFGVDNAKMGNILHNAFEEYYKKYPNFEYDKFKEIYKKFCEKMGVDFYSLYYSLANVKKLAKELEKHEDSWKFSESEKEYKGVKFGEFATLEGRIDRIDTDANGDRFIIDYKSGNADAKSLQLKFYKALLGDDEAGCAYLSLKNGKFVNDENKKDFGDMSASEILSKIFGEIKDECENEVIFERAQKDSECKYCPYKIICKGEIDE